MQRQVQGDWPEYTERPLRRNWGRVEEPEAGVTERGEGAEQGGTSGRGMPDIGKANTTGSAGLPAVTAGVGMGVGLGAFRFIINNDGWNGPSTSSSILVPACVLLASIHSSFHTSQDPLGGLFLIFFN
ncbi:uncharacterized protein LOC135168922 [Diachasmimorpha longicaudata]|uniref:uncharacterized protein LOC135168922 n=1 Tax=Diachasmimorpha longicaudata TaxID=58733 RepID=UPI0030B8CD68